MDFSSKLLENAVYEIAQLPSIGKRTALRLALHLLKQPEEQSLQLAQAIVALRTHIQYCKNCHNISDVDLCEICANPTRDTGIICVVEDFRDVMAIENTGQFRGQYHVLHIASLIEKVKAGKVTELILALSNTMEGDTTNFYIYKQVEPYHITISTIARGIAVGSELEYTDEVTLGRSIAHRIPFEKAIKAV